ncbi:MULTISPECIES: hypothetical protein [Heyndrickxia]|uniref:hypothetical protein n=1 Tax=Heyndrickxia TaxID=2837504 RepID=UPI001B1C52F5|nr:hypothetical protein [Heyndrickxia oleronia]GIN39922.1 hypothetical protein J19TS1_28710 [Heyndrickxia oleronia]
MDIQELGQKINQCTEDLDFLSARRYIEENLIILEDHKYLLKSNAREIFNFVKERLESGYPPLTKQEKAVINSINTYAYNFDLRGIKLVLKSKAKLFLREDIISYLNEDARNLLKSMGAINE